MPCLNATLYEIITNSHLSFGTQHLTLVLCVCSCSVTKTHQGRQLSPEHSLFHSRSVRCQVQSNSVDLSSVFWCKHVFRLPVKWKKASLLISQSLTVVFHPERDGLERSCVPEDILRLFYVCEKCGGGCAWRDRCQSINIDKNQCSWVLWMLPSCHKNHQMTWHFQKIWCFDTVTVFPKTTHYDQHTSVCLSRQNLVVEGERYPIILNTHFSQKVCEETKSDNAGGPRAAVAVEKCRPLSLTRSLWRSGTSQVSTETSIPCKQVRQLSSLMWSWEGNWNSQKSECLC